MNANISMIVIAVLFATTGCATQAQITTATAADVVEADAPTATSEVPVTDEEVIALLQEYDHDGDGWAYVPPADAAPALGNGTILVPNDEIDLEGTVVANDDDVIEVRLTDGRRVRVATLSDGSVAWHIVGTGVSTGLWRAPENSSLEYSRGVDSRGVSLSLPAPAVHALERDLAAR